MFRLLLIVVLVVSGFTSSLMSKASVPLAPIEMTLKQPNGFTFIAKANGNIHHHWIETIDGHRISKKTDGVWYYVLINKQLKPYPSDIPVGQLAARHKKGKKTGEKIVLPSREQFAVAKEKHEKQNIKQSTSNQPKSKPQGKKNLTPQLDPQHLNATKVTSLSEINLWQQQRNHFLNKIPHPLGEQKIMVILVDYADVSFTYSDESFRELIFGDNGVNDFYKNASYNQLSLVPATETFGTSNDGVIHISLTSNHFNTQFPQASDVTTILQRADAFFNGADFDSDNDGTISTTELSIVIITAGYEDSYGGGVIEPGVWGHKWSIGRATLDNKNFGPYTMFGERHATNSSNEHQATIGIMAHELGHLMLDLPDLYDTDNSSEGIGQWGLMGGGSWNTVAGKFSGAAPADFTAWSKMEVGFDSATTINDNQSLTVNHATQNGNYYKLWADKYRLGEYFLLENRRNTTSSVVNGEGLLITHIDPSQSSNANDSRRLVDVEDADGTMSSRGDASDLFPGSQNISQFGPTTTPNTNDNSGQATDVNITGISQSSDNIVISAITPTPSNLGHLKYFQSNQNLFNYGFSETGVWTALKLTNSTTYDTIDGISVELPEAGSVDIYLYDSMVNASLGSVVHQQTGFNGQEGNNRFMLSQGYNFEPNNEMVLVLNIKLNSHKFPARVYYSMANNGNSFVAQNSTDTFSSLPYDLAQALLMSSQTVQPIDTDNDGISDDADNCPNTPNSDQLNTDGADDGGDACDLDDDNDQIPDEWELWYGTNPLVNDAQLDSDNDGHSNYEEYQANTDPQSNISQPNGNGKTLWQLDGTTGAVYSPPAINADGTVYSTNSAGQLQAHSADGTQLWQVSIKANYQSATMLADDGSIYQMDTNNTLIALNSQGQTLWTFDFGNPTINQPNLGRDGTIYHATRAGVVYAIDAQGAEKWRLALSVATELYHHIMVTGSDNILVSDGAGSIYSISSSGQIYWQKSFDSLQYAAFSADKYGSIYVSHNSGVFAINELGDKLWDNNLGVQFFHGFVVDKEDNLIGQGTNGHVYSLNSTTGGINWQYNLTAVGTVNASPTVTDDGSILVSNGNNMLISLDKSGLLRWKKQIGYSLYTSPAVGPDGTIYTATQTNLTAINNDQILFDSGWYTLGGNNSHSYSAPKSVVRSELNPNIIMSWLLLLMPEE